jgi:stringent starvation protein B
MSTPPLPTRPYLVRAIYEWAQDNGFTPYLLVNADEPHVNVPRQHVKDGQIVLNIAMHAVQHLQLENDAIHFSARFGGVPINIFVPMRSVLGLYARENGQGLFFDPQEYPALDVQTDAAPTDSTPEAPKKSGLRVLD